MKAIDIKCNLAVVEVETRMKIAEVSTQLLGIMTSAGFKPSMEGYMQIYRELSNEILEPFTEITNNVVPKVPEE
jgi:hypothetical protein